MVFFLSKKKVLGILVGSSNFSYTTYLTNKASEADILMVDYQHEINNISYASTNTVSNAGFIKTINDQLLRDSNGTEFIVGHDDRRIYEQLFETNSADAYFDDFKPLNSPNRGTLGKSVLISISINSSGFLQDIFDSMESQAKYRK